MVPFPQLPKLASHEEQLLARVSVHPRIKHPEIGKFLPFVPGHLIEQRTLAVHHLVVTEHEYEVLLKSVHDRERDVILMKASVDRIERHVVQKIVHPPHVPLEAESQTAQISRPRNARPRS